VTRAERTLLLALFRWARAEGGVQYGRLHRWSHRGESREQWWGVDFFDDGDYVSIWRGRDNARDYWVRDIAEAVDVLAALGIVPARFSTAYRAGYDAAMQAHHIAKTSPPGQSYRADIRPRGWRDPDIYALLPAADHELAVRR
jgi:hypothetical protein